VPSAPIDHLSLDHLGIAVRDLDAACALYRLLGTDASEREIIAHEQVEVAILPLAAGGRIELLQPTAADSPVGRFLERRGEGLHHVALRVPDLSAALRRLQAAGVRLVHDEVRTGAGGHRYVFVHPSAASGVLLELVEAGRGGIAT